MRDLTLFTVSLLSILNPLAIVPTFVGMTEGVPRPELRRMTRVTATAVFGVLAVSYVAGSALLEFFSIRVASLRVAGGVLIFAMAWSMLQATVSRAKQTSEEAAEMSERSSIAVVPLAMPLLAGPGSISLMIIVAGQTEGLLPNLLTLGATAAVATLTWLVLLAAAPISRALGRTGLNVFTRFMGLILAAIAIEFIASGLLEILPGLAHAAGAGT